MPSPHNDHDDNETNDDLEDLYRRFKALTNTKQLETDLKGVQEQTRRYSPEGSSSVDHQAEEDEDDQEEEEEDKDVSTSGENLYDVDDAEVEQYLAGFSSTPELSRLPPGNLFAPVPVPRDLDGHRTRPTKTDGVQNQEQDQDAVTKEEEEKEVDREAEEIVRRFKEEVDLDREYGQDEGEDTGDEEGDGKDKSRVIGVTPTESNTNRIEFSATPNSKSKETDPLARLASLSTPKDLKPSPTISDSDSPTEELDPTYARLLSLKPISTRVDLPSVPTKSLDGSSGSKKGVNGVTKKSGWDVPGWTNDRDDDLDSWCCICNADAALICVTCDSDPFCQTCWTEGHGDGPGKEKGHRVKEFVRKKDLVELEVGVG